MYSFKHRGYLFSGSFKNAVGNGLMRHGVGGGQVELASNDKEDRAHRREARVSAGRHADGRSLDRQTDANLEHAHSLLNVIADALDPTGESS
ncbi:hypothetical protein [Caballeronia sp. LZ035]|uniref:hypothetical protein n=1 Tax=Caballeronia sp. LZ035 TaxID=3038568 RepID=UPI00285B4B9D|nr:hypothetical protein [Caballeronia sp. LZ035]MDR5763067.1 hypothetical protein [Caballeronia sp. LZ035]